MMFGSRRRGLECLPSSNPRIAFVSVALRGEPGDQLGYDCLLGHQDVEVDDWLGGAPGHGRTADMLDGHSQIRDVRCQSLPQILEPLGPSGVVVTDHDHVSHVDSLAGSPGPSHLSESLAIAYRVVIYDPSEDALFMMISDLNYSDNTFVVVKSTRTTPPGSPVAVLDEGGYEIVRATPLWPGQREVVATQAAAGPESA